MTLAIDLTPAEELRLRVAAQQKGIAPAELVGLLTNPQKTPEPRAITRWALDMMATGHRTRGAIRLQQVMRQSWYRLAACVSLCH